MNSAGSPPHDMNTTNLSTVISTWTREQYPGFVSCVNKLASLKDVDAKELIPLLHQLRDQSHLLPEHLARQLLEPLIDPRVWNCTSNTTATEATTAAASDQTVSFAVIQLLISLTVHFNELSQDVIDVFVTLLFSQTESPFTSSSPAFNFFHKLLTAAPQSERLVTERILYKFPGWRKPLNEVSEAVLNTLYLFCAPSTSVRFSNSSKCLLISELSQLVIDLEFGLDETETPPLVEYAPCNSKSQEVQCDTFESMHSSLVQTLSDTSHTSPPNNWTKLNRVAWIILSHARFLCSKGDAVQPELDWALLCDVFKKLRELFAQHILPVSTAISAFPLIFLYTTSLRGGLMVSLTEFLWKAVKNEHTNVGYRLNALSYLTFLMTGVSACFLDLVVELLHEMTGWCVDYVYRNRARIAVTNATVLYQENSVYYATCDSIFYCLVQLQSLLFDSSYYRESCDRLPLAQIRLSPLDPWSHMPVRTRHALSQLVFAYNLGGWCLSVLDADSLAVNHNHVDTFTVHDLANLEPSNLFTLPARSTHLSLCANLQFQLLRPFSLGKLILNGTTHAAGKTSTKCSNRKRRKRPTPPSTTGSNVSHHHPGVDVAKLTRILHGS